MKREELIEKLNQAKSLTSVVSIDSVILMLNDLEPERVVETQLGLTKESLEEIENTISSALNRYDSDRFIDFDSAEFDIDWGNKLTLSRVDLDVDVITGAIFDELEKMLVEEENENEQ